MPFLRPTSAQKFTPKKIQFSKFYKSNAKGGKLGDNVLADIKSTLRQAGYGDSQISEIITADKPTAAGTIKEIAGVLGRARVYGFEKNQDRAVKQYLNKERVKAQNIADIRKEHILEAAEENLANVGTTSLNQKAVGPNTVKPGQASVLSRRRGSPAIRSLSGQANSSRTGSLIGRSAGVSSIPHAGAGVSTRPKY